MGATRLASGKKAISNSKQSLVNADSLSSPDAGRVAPISGSVLW